MSSSKREKRNKRILSDNEINEIVEKTGGDITLQEIGDLYGLTRMRVCQIEKLSLKKLRDSFPEKL